jgi:hypothetical protein
LVIDRLAVMKEHHETRQSVIDRLQMFVQDSRLRRILCEAPPIDIETIVDKKLTFILDCHGINEDKFIFCGNLVTQMIKNYFRYNRKDKYEPLVFYADECHNFVNANTFNLLREGRKYSISAVMATTDFAGMGDRLVHTICSNVGTIVAFRCGFREAVQVSKEFKTLSLEDIQFLSKYHAAVKTPEVESIVKTQQAPPVKKVRIPKKEEKPKQTLGLKWFTLKKSCHSKDDFDHQGEVFAETQSKGVEIPLSQDG